MKKVNLFLLCFLLLICTACKMGLDSIKRSTELEFITIDLDETRSLYAVNDVFNKESVKIIGHYSDGTTKEENSLIAEFYGFDSSKEQKEQPITVLFNGKQTVFNIEIGEKSEDYILIKNFPKKLFYFANKLTISDLKKEDNLAGLKVELYYNDGTSIPLDWKKNDYRIEMNSPEISLSKNKKREVQVYVRRNDLPTDFFSVYLLSSKDFDHIESSRNKGPDCNCFYSSEEIDFYGMQIDNSIIYKIKKTVLGINWGPFIHYDYEQEIITIRDGRCYIEDRIVPSDYSASSFSTKAIINDKEISIPIGIDNHIFVEAEATISNDVFFVGKEINFQEAVKFWALYHNSEHMEEITDTNNLGYFIPNGETQTYSIDHFIPISQSARFENFGYNKVIFFYKYVDLRQNQESYFFWEEYFYVHDAKMDCIKLSWGENGEPDALDPDEDWNSDKLYEVLKDTLQVIGYYTDEKIHFEIESNRWTVNAFEKPKIEDDDYDIKPFWVEICYHGEGVNQFYYGRINVPYQRKRPESSSS